MKVCEGSGPSTNLTMFEWEKYSQHGLMLKWFTSLVLVAALCGSVSAGVQMHTGMEMNMMDCCKAALAHNDSVATSLARLCCAVNCPEPVPTGSSMVQPLSASAAPQAAAKIPSPFLQDFNSRLTGYRTRRYSTHSPPAYISNLALLI